MRIALMVAIATTDAIPTKERSTQKRPVEPATVSFAGARGLCGHPCIYKNYNSKFLIT
jgi:hypothetical protein